eukprot:118710-Prymnesium_polylepis.1
MTWARRLVSNMIPQGVYACFSRLSPTAGMGIYDIHRTSRRGSGRATSGAETGVRSGPGRAAACGAER